MSSVFTPGDAVQHKSGGPKMIFIGTSQLGDAICEWFEGSRRRNETFSFAAIEPYEPPFTAAVGPLVI